MLFQIFFFNSFKKKSTGSDLPNSPDDRVDDTTNAQGTLRLNFDQDQVSRSPLFVEFVRGALRASEQSILIKTKIPVAIQQIYSFAV